MASVQGMGLGDKEREMEENFTSPTGVLFGRPRQSDKGSGTEELVISYMISKPKLKNYLHFSKLKN